MAHQHDENCNHEHEHSDSENSENAEESSQELMFKASLVEKHLQELNEKIEYLSQQLLEMEQFSKDISFINNAEGKEILAPVGKGIYLKSSLEGKNLFVNVGSGIVVKKSFEETRAIIESQIRSFHEARNQLMAQLEVYTRFMLETMAAIEKQNSSQ